MLQDFFDIQYLLLTFRLSHPGRKEFRRLYQFYRKYALTGTNFPLIMILLACAPISKLPSIISIMGLSVTLPGTPGRSPRAGPGRAPSSPSAQTLTPRCSKEGLPCGFGGHAAAHREARGVAGGCVCHQAAHGRRQRVAGRSGRA